MVDSHTFWIRLWALWQHKENLAINMVVATSGDVYWLVSLVEPHSSIHKCLLPARMVSIIHVIAYPSLLVAWNNWTYMHRGAHQRLNEFLRESCIQKWVQPVISTWASYIHVSLVQCAWELIFGHTTVSGWLNPFPSLYAMSLDMSCRHILMDNNDSILQCTKCSYFFFAYWFSFCWFTWSITACGDRADYCSYAIIYNKLLHAKVRTGT